MTFSLHAFQNWDALDGDGAAGVKLEIPEESRVSFDVVTRNVDSTEEVIVEICPDANLMLGAKGNAGFDATRDGSK